MTAGATPNEITSQSESSSRPRSLVACARRATFPSSASNTMANRISPPDQPIQW